MSQLVLMRHGESEWNKRNLFTGWVDVPLSEAGVQEAIEGGRRIQEIPIDIIFTTTLMRALMTAMLAMLHHSSGKVPIILHEGKGKQSEWSQIYSEETKKQCIPVICTSELNERMYGKLQGLNKAETAEKFGVEQVKLWRRSYDIAPPDGESLKITAERSIPYFEQKIVPLLKQGKNVFVSAHGNSLRSIIMDLDQLSEQEVLQLEIPTGVPIIYECLDGKIVRSR